MSSVMLINSMSILSPHITPESQERLEKLKIHLNSLLQFLGDKARVVPVVASLSATVLVVATFNPDLLTVTIGLKVVLTILLALIPVSLLFHLLELFTAIRKVNVAIKKMHNDQELLPVESMITGVLNTLVGYFPFVGTVILGSAIVYIIYALWH